MSVELGGSFTGGFRFLGGGFYGRFFGIVGRLAAWSILRANQSLHKSPEINKRNDHASRSGKNKLILLQPCPEMEERIFLVVP